MPLNAAICGTRPRDDEEDTMLDDRPWVDGPWPLLETPSKSRDVVRLKLKPKAESPELKAESWCRDYPTRVHVELTACEPTLQQTHSALFIADDMASMHNLIIRGLNSIYVQAPFVTLRPDAVDFLFYIHCWCDLVEVHHGAEETSLFPAIEALAGKPGLLAHPAQQHRGFVDGIQALHDYAQNTDPAAYSAAEVRSLLTGFADPLHGHLADEVAELCDLTNLDSDRLLQCHRDAERSRHNPHPEETYPLLLGLADNTYAGTGADRYPAVPFFVPWLVHYWIARKHAGAWRFLPCDFWGRPKPLTFVRRVGLRSDGMRSDGVRSTAARSDAARSDITRP